jgi:serine/threonine protein kinase
LTFVKRGTTLAPAMKECPTCFRCWNDAEEICSDDNAPLQSAFVGPAILDGKYRVDQRLGRGGMGIVYRVHHLGLHKAFALKVIATFDKAFAARFREEAETLGKLKHPNIVAVTDFGIDTRGDGLPYLVMEYLEGSTLADWLRRLGPLPPERALPIFESIAEAIDHAHDRNILHLDLKPGNVFVADVEPQRETVKILDFGLARVVSDLSGGERREQITPDREADRFDDGVAAASLLRLGLGADERPTSGSLEPLSAQRCLGTPAYMAPELFAGEAATRASDIYSFGVLIYEVLVGRVPFEGTVANIVAGHCSGPPPPPSTLNAALAREFDNALLPALEQLPAHRPKRAADVVGLIRSAAARARARTWREKEIPRRIAVAALAGVFLPIVLAPVSQSNLFEQIEHRSIDARFLASPARAPDQRLLLVSLDEASLNADPTPLTQKADEFGRLLEGVFERGARAVAVDFLLPEAWSRSNAFSTLVLKHPEALTLAAFSSPAGDVIGPECLNALTAAALGPQRASDLFAFVNVDEDSDGVIRRAWRSYTDQSGNERDTWARRAVRSFEGPSLRSSSDRSPTGVVLRERSRFWIDYAADWRRIKRISWKDLAATLDREAGMFRGQLVLVGGDFVGSGGDYHKSPFQAEATPGISGLVLQALIVNTLLSGFQLRELSPFSSLLTAGGAVAAVMLTFLLSFRALIPVLLLMAIISLYVGASYLLFLRMHVLLPVVGPLLTTAVATVLALTLRFALPAFPLARTDGP